MESPSLVGNERLRGRVRSNGVLEDVFFPSREIRRYSPRSQFGVFSERRRQLTWLAEGCTREQRPLDGMSGVETSVEHPDGIEARLVDFVPGGHDVFVRVLELRNPLSYPKRLAVIHAEAAALETGDGDLCLDAAYVNRQRRVLRYRRQSPQRPSAGGYCVLIHGSPRPDEYQVGRAFARYGPDLDSFHDALDGRLQGNDLCSGSEDGSTSAFLWHLELAPGATARVGVYFSGGATTHEAEKRLDGALGTAADRVSRELVTTPPGSLAWAASGAP